MRTATFILGAIFFAVGCVGIVGSWVVHGKHSRAYTEGTRVHGEVLSKQFLAAADGSSEHLVEFRFELPSGALVEGVANLPRERWEQLRQGDAILLAYLPEEPARAVLPESGKPSFLLPAVASAVFLALAALGLGLVVASLRKSKQNVV